MLWRILVYCTATLSMLSIASAQTTIQLGYGLPKAAFVGDFGDAFAAEANEASGGSIIIEQIPSHFGGNERAIIEAVQLGTLTAAFVGTAAASNFVPDGAVFELPFLFDDISHLRKVLDGEIGEEVRAKFEPKGFVALGFADVGFRNITTSTKPVRAVEDLDGLKIRTQQFDSHLLAFRELGALPTPMAFSEVFPALQTGTIDGQENPVSVLVPTKLYEAQKYLSLTRHAATNMVLLISPSVWSGLSEAEKGWLMKAARKGIEGMRARVDADEVNALEFLRDDGRMEIIDTIEMQPFKEKLTAAYGAFEDQFGRELLDRIKAEN